MGIYFTQKKAWIITIILMVLLLFVALRIDDIAAHELSTSKRGVERLTVTQRKNIHMLYPTHYPFENSEVSFLYRPWGTMT